MKIDSSNMFVRRSFTVDIIPIFNELLYDYPLVPVNTGIHKSLVYREDPDEMLPIADFYLT